MFSHVVIGANDLTHAMNFYDAVMPALGYSRQDTGDTYLGYGKPEDIGSGVNCLFVSKPFDDASATPGNGTNVALLASSRQQVDRFHELGLISGGSCEGPPGLRDVHPHFYAAYLRDPCGNKLAVVCHKAVEGE